MDFNKKIFDVRKDRKYPFLAAHRGTCGANIPCNTIEAYKIAVDEGADVVEIDVSISKDKHFYVFHPGMEPVFLNCGKYLSEMNSDEIDELVLLNSDRVPTHYHIPKLIDVLNFLKDKVYINVDKFWTDVEGISKIIREAGVEKQVIVKTYIEDGMLEQVEKFASDFMYMPLVWHKDDLTEKMSKLNINYIGLEILFDKESDEICQSEYIKSMHDKGYLIWANSIVYNEKDVISAYHTDDRSLIEGGDVGWGYLADIGADFIQTDFVAQAKRYFNK